MHSEFLYTGQELAGTLYESAGYQQTLRTEIWVEVGQVAGSHVGIADLRQTIEESLLGLVPQSLKGPQVGVQDLQPET